MVVPSLCADLVCVPMQALFEYESIEVFEYESIEVYFCLNWNRNLEKRMNLLCDD
jgi:hypothetical protein